MKSLFVNPFCYSKKTIAAIFLLGSILTPSVTNLDFFQRTATDGYSGEPGDGWSIWRDYKIRLCLSMYSHEVPGFKENLRQPCCRKAHVSWAAIASQTKCQAYCSYCYRIVSSWSWLRLHAFSMVMYFSYCALCAHYESVRRWKKAC